MNGRAKFDAASFILSREICNRTNIHTHTKLQKKHKQTVNDISTPCLLACVDNEYNVSMLVVGTCEEVYLATSNGYHFHPYGIQCICCGNSS